MPIFDDIERTDPGLPRAGDTRFGYLNRSARPEAGRIRALLEQWVDRYPAEHRLALVSRLRAPIDDMHSSALFELILHELILRAGHRVAAIEPVLPHTTRSPDFLIETASGGRFYLEAVLATGRSREETAAQARLETAVGAIEAVPSPHHYFDLHIEGTPASPVTLRRLRSQLTAWVTALPEGDASGATPFEYAEHGVSFRITAIRRRSAVATRSVGVRFNGVRVLVPGQGIRESVEKKASRYGRLNAPYVVAVNALGMASDERDAIDAPFGTPQLTIRRYHSGSIVEIPTRAPDGVWAGSRPRNRGLSAVLSFDRVCAWSIAQRTGCLIRNPWATMPLSRTPLLLAERIPQDGNLVEIQGQNLADIFGLPSGWPE